MFLHSAFKKIPDLVNIVHIIWHCLLLHYCALTCTICMYILYRSWGWMCITSETCRANGVIKKALNNLHQAGPNKTHIWWCMETQKSNALFGIWKVEIEKGETVVDPFITLRMEKWVVEICLWLLCNKTTFIHPSAFVGLFLKKNVWLVHETWIILKNE